MFHKTHVPYTPLPNNLQHLEVWVPAAYTSQTHAESLPASWLPPPNTTWVIYIHGGAWRDPLETAADFTPALQHLSPEVFESKAPVAFASISYSLSGYPGHSTCPSSPSEYSRNVRHPRHVLDVLTGLSFLQQRAGFGSNYILVGHSCGATLAFQAALRPERWGVDSGKAFVEAPRMVVGLNGLYDLPVLVADPGDGYKKYCGVYEEFVRSAFGDDEEQWRVVSPVYVGDWAGEWPEGRHVLLVQSREDTLVPFEQMERLRDGLLKSGGGKLGVEVVEGYGDHYDIWKYGKQLAGVLERAIDVFGS